MSWNIFIYAEYKKTDDAEWKPLTEHSVFDNFKHFSDDFYESLPCMNASNAAHPYVKSLSSDIYSGGFSVKYCKLSEFRSHYYSEIDKFNEKLKSVYSALGVSNLCIDDEDYWYEDECDIDEDENKDNSFPWIKYMTFPVNKKLLTELAYSFHVYNKANKMIGFCDTIDSMVNYDDEVRLIFAML